MAQSYSFDPALICQSCTLAPSSPARLVDQVNGAVGAAYHNLLARGITPHQAVRSAITVLRIHHPDLCPCNAHRVRDWLLSSD